MASFQSSPSPKAGSYHSFGPTPSQHSSVSILSQPEGRELLGFWSGDKTRRVFQSSPSPKAGSYDFDWTLFFYFICFNPLPARRPGATTRLISPSCTVTVSILSQPEGRELHRQPSFGYSFILFQSSPSPKAGSYRSRSSGFMLHTSFNPLPARRPGATFPTPTKRNC